MLRETYAKLLERWFEEMNPSNKVLLDLDYRAGYLSEFARAEYGPGGTYVIRLDIDVCLDLDLDFFEIKFVLAHELGHCIGSQSTTHEYAGVPMDKLPRDIILFREVEADIIAAKITGFTVKDYKKLRKKLRDIVLNCMADEGIDESVMDKFCQFTKEQIKAVIKAA